MLLRFIFIGKLPEPFKESQTTPKGGYHLTYKDFLERIANLLLKHGKAEYKRGVKDFRSLVRVEDYEWDGGKEIWEQHLNSLTTKKEEVAND